MCYLESPARIYRIAVIGSLGLLFLFLGCDHPISSPVPISNRISCVSDSNSVHFVVKGVPFTMVKVESGTFIMGNTNPFYAREQDENPSHSVTLTRDFYIAETEVTQELWQALMGENPSYKYNRSPQRPVDGISLEMALDFLDVLKKETGLEFRLPTEAEWEFACKGGIHSKGYKYSGSDRLRNVGWFCDNTGETSHNVKELQPNELGIYDMSGNVWEWCSDCFYDYTEEPQIDPVGAENGKHLVRGGCWYTYSNFCRTTNRSIGTQQNNNLFTGIRLAISTNQIMGY